MTILTIENRYAVASAVTGKEHTAEYAPAIKKHEIVPYSDGAYDWDDLWDPKRRPEQWLALVAWISGRLLESIKSGKKVYNRTELFEFLEAASDDDSSALEEMAFDILVASK